MRKFIVLLTGRGEGCDYTIGCGYKFYFKEANSAQEVWNSIKSDYVNFEEDYIDKDSLSKVEIVEVSKDSLSIDFDDVIKEFKLFQEKKRQIEQIEWDKREFERLKNKLGR